MDHMNHMYRHRVHGTTHFSGNFTCTITSFFTKKFLHYIVVLKSFLTLAVVPCASRLNSFSFSLSLSVCLSLSRERALWKCWYHISVLNLAKFGCKVTGKP